MFKAIGGFFKRQIYTYEKAHAKMSWEEALDLAIFQISELEDIDSDKGKYKLGLIIDDLKLKQLVTNQTKSETNIDGSEQSADDGNVIVYYDLPWENVPEEAARQLTKDIYGIGVDEEVLLRQTEELEYEFNFDIDNYIVLASIMLKLDLNLKKSRHELVPEMITEDDFWRNYFYRIEYMKKELGISSHRLGPRIPDSRRAEKLQSRSAQLATDDVYDEEEAATQSQATLRQAAAGSAPNEIELKTLSKERDEDNLHDQTADSNSLVLEDSKEDNV